MYLFFLFMGLRVIWKRFILDGCILVGLVWVGFVLCEKSSGCLGYVFFMFILRVREYKLNYMCICKVFVWIIFVYCLRINGGYTVKFKVIEIRKDFILKKVWGVNNG